MPRTVTERDGCEPDANSGLVRPFILTGGRTRSDGVAVAIEAIVDRRPSPAREEPDLAPVELEIWRAAELQLSSAEISARLDVPVGVVRVLVGDLVAAGHLRLGPTAAANDVNLIKRLIDGIRSL